MSDDVKRRILRAEATLLRIPIFALAVKGSASLDGFEFRLARRRGDGLVESVIRTERDGKTSYPGPLSRRVHMAVLSVVTDRGFPFENPVCWTWRDLCRRMGLPNSGRRVGELKEAIRATWGLKIFGLLTLDSRARESWRRLYVECEFQNTAREDGTVADANRLWLAPWYLDSLNILHSAPVDYELWKRLEGVGPLASRLYEYLIPSFYKRDALELAYDRLTAAMPVVAESRRSHAIRQFSAALSALKTEGVLDDSVWCAMKGTGRPKLMLRRGPLLTPPTPAARGEASKIGAAEAPDPNAPDRVAAEFYRLLGKDSRPLRSDLAVARDLIARFGLSSTLDLMPEAVRRLKARFRNAETMGALLRYFEEAAQAAARRTRAAEQLDGQTAERAAARSTSARDDECRRAAWAALTDAEREAVREAVLAEQPICRRFPPLLDAACLQKLTIHDPAPKSLGG
jgi:hypothetical protein